jgi:MFS family permease
MSPEEQQERRSGLETLLRGLGEVYGDRLFWRIAPLAVPLVSYGLAVQGLWIGPYLRELGGLSGEAAAEHLFWTAASLTLGFLLAGFLADRLERLGVPLSTSFFLLALAFMASQIPIVFQWDPSALWPWVIFALTGNGTAIVFAVLSRHFPSELSGRANTALNLLIFSGAFAIQYAIGAIVEFFPGSGDGLGSPAGYQAAFGVFLALQCAGLLWYLAASRWAPAEGRP